MKLFSNKSRPIHLGNYPLEDLPRTNFQSAMLEQIAPPEDLKFRMPEQPQNIANAMAEAQAMLDVIRDGQINPARAEIPADLAERQNHLKSFAYFSDISMVATCKIEEKMWCDKPLRNPDIDLVADLLRTKQTKSLASGVDMIMADLRDAVNTPLQSIEHHSHAIVLMMKMPRAAKKNEAGYEWIKGAEKQCAALRANEVAAVLAQYIRLLGYSARAHSMTSADINLNHLAVASGLALQENEKLQNPFLKQNFALAAVTCDMAFGVDQPLTPEAMRAAGKGWGSAFKQPADPYEKRDFALGAHPFETLKRVDNPTTFIDEERVPRVPKRTDMFARSLFGDMGKRNQEAAKGGKYVRKSAPSMAQRRALGAFVLLQDGDPAPKKQQIAPDVAAQNIKAISYFLGLDAVGNSRCSDWTWYSHDANGDPITPPHDNAISMVVDQGYDTMEGASGDDWIAVSQSMRAYLRFAILGSVVAKQIRNLGYKAKAHTVMDGEVLQPPLLLLSGLGEVSRIGEVILNPFLGPRLKSGVVTTDLTLEHDKPISFGLQQFCESCNKCARECPSGAITAGPKLMFNGYEIWKSDSQKCTTYRITNEGGAMCGRCMKTCPWNLEGTFKEAPFRWVAMNVPQLAPVLAKLDDVANNGTINPIKKWWWDLELQENGSYKPTDKPVHNRELQKDLKLKYEDQTLAVYPANLAPPPWPFPYPMDREKGIEAYQALITAQQYKARLAKGETDGLAHEYRIDGDAPVIPVIIAKAEQMTDKVTKYEFQTIDGSPLPAWTAGAHLDIVVAPEYLRQYSMSGDPKDRSKYQIGVLREDQGRGGSALLHRIFTEGRKIYISKPINHFELNEQADKTYLMGGGIGITPMIAMAHRLHDIGSNFELHYSASSRKETGYLADLDQFPWAKHVHLHFSDEGSRADLDKILSQYAPNQHVYTCGPERYMQSVLDAAERCGFKEDERHFEYFNVPEMPEYENHPFVLQLAKSGKRLTVPADKTATDILQENGIAIDVKCSDGICGVCQCGLVDGEVEHRDFVLSKSQRESRVILCQSRAAKPNGEITVDL
jgi:reductive dehalogenase